MFDPGSDLARSTCPLGDPQRRRVTIIDNNIVIAELSNIINSHAHDMTCFYYKSMVVKDKYELRVNLEGNLNVSYAVSKSIEFCHSSCNHGDCHRSRAVASV